MKTFNKLVRDKIPEIIAQNGDSATFHVANDTEYQSALYAKLLEEAQEFAADKTMSEAADLLEVLYTIAELEGWALQDIETLRQEKAEKRGAFEKRIILETTE